MRVIELLAVLSNADPRAHVFINDKPAAITLSGVGYVCITDHVIHPKVDTFDLNGVEYEANYNQLTISKEN